MAAAPQNLFPVGRSIASVSFAGQRQEMRPWLPIEPSEPETLFPPGGQSSEAEPMATREPVTTTPETDSATAEAAGAADTMMAGTPPEPAVQVQIDAALARQREELIAEHTAALEQLRTTAYDEGRASRDEEIDAAVGEVAQAVSQLADAHNRLSRAYRHEAVELALALARAVVGRAVQTTDDALLVVVERALAQVPARDELVLRCHPDDALALARAVPTLALESGEPIGFRLVESVAVGRGGVIIDFGTGSIDARPSTALTVLEEALEGALAGPVALGDDAPAADAEV